MNFLRKELQARIQTETNAIDKIDYLVDGYCRYGYVEYCRYVSV
jgi:hypothetical protein